MELHSDLGEDGVLTLTMDDGNKNALLPETFEAITGEVDHASEDVQAIVLAGNGEIFTAGLDVKWMKRATRDEVGAMLVGLGRCVMRLWGEGRPTVAACTGHSVAAGTMLAMACDHAIAAEGPFRWGLMETRIAFEMPRFGIELTRANVAAHKVDDLILPGAVLSPAEAVAVGYADEALPIEDVVAAAQQKARELVELPSHTYAGTKRRLRQDTIEKVLGGIEADIEAVMATGPIP